MASDQLDFKHVMTVIKAVQKSVIDVRQNVDQNDTYDISMPSHTIHADRPDPLRFTEIIIVISVLLLWCLSIFIFIRHSELLRIRHRDLPIRSAIKSQPSTTNLNYVSVINRSSEFNIQSKSRVSSPGGGVTPPIHRYLFQNHRRPDTIETISLCISPEAKKRRHTHSYDLNISTISKYSSIKPNDKEYLLRPNQKSSDRKHSIIQLQQKSCDNLPRKSVDNLSSVKYSIFHSTNDMSRRKANDIQHLFNKKRCAHESPV